LTITSAIETGDAYASLARKIMPRFMVFNKQLKGLEDYAGVAAFTSRNRYSYGKLKQQKRNKRRRQNRRQTQPESKKVYHGLHIGTETEDNTRPPTDHSYSQLSKETPDFRSATKFFWRTRKTTTKDDSCEKNKISAPRDESTVSSTSNGDLLEQFPIGRSDKSLKISDSDKSTTSKTSHEKKAVDTTKKRKIEEASFDSIVRSAKIFSAMKSSQASAARSSGQDMKIDYPVWTTADSFKSWDNNDSKNVFEGVDSGGSGNIDKSWDDEYIPTSKMLKGTTNHHKNHAMDRTKYSSSVFDNLDRDTLTKHSSSLFENLGDDEGSKVKLQQLKVNESREDDDGRHEKNDVSKDDPLSTGREESFDGGSFEALTFSAGESNDSEVSDVDPFKEIFKVFRCTDRQRSFYSNEDDVNNNSSPRARRTSMNIKEVSVPTKAIRNNEENGKHEVDQSNDRSPSQSQSDQKTDSEIKVTDRNAENLDEKYAGRESTNPTALDIADAGRSKGVILQEEDVADLAETLLSTNIHDDNDRDNIQQDIAIDVGDNQAAMTNEQTSPLSRQPPQPHPLHWHAVTSPRKKIAISDVTTLPDNLTPVARLRFCRTAYGATKMLV